MLVFLCMFVCVRCSGQYSGSNAQHIAHNMITITRSHRRAVERLHEERDEAHAAVETLQAQVEEERQHGVVAVEEVRMCV